MLMSDVAFDNPVKLVIFSVIGGTVLLCCCVCALSAWADRDARKLAPQSPFDAKRRLNGLQEVTEHIELIGARPNDAREHARQVRFMVGRGFAPELVRSVLRGDDDESPRGALPNGTSC